MHVFDYTNPYIVYAYASFEFRHFCVFFSLDVATKTQYF